MAKQHYTTMTTKNISNLPIRNLCTDNAICFMWATFPKITEALNVIKEWGFTYKTAAFIWIKQNKNKDSLYMGMGAYTRANAEICLLGISKKTKATEIVKSHAVRQVIISRKEEHSKKPDEIRQRIVTLLGDIPRIELFARQQVQGWDCWGNEV